MGWRHHGAEYRPHHLHPRSRHRWHTLGWRTGDGAALAKCGHTHDHPEVPEGRGEERGPLAQQLFSRVPRVPMSLGAFLDCRISIRSTHACVCMCQEKPKASIRTQK